MLTIKKSFGFGTLATIFITVFISMLLVASLSITVLLTKEPIKQNLIQKTRESVNEAIPGISEVVTFIIDENDNVTKLTDEKSQTGHKIYAGYDSSGELMAVAIKAFVNGYSGPKSLVMLYAYTPNRECITGISVIKNIETDGFGKKVSDKQHSYRDNYECLDMCLVGNGLMLTLSNPIKTENGKYRIDGISGATVTSNAVAGALDISTKKIIPIIVSNLEIIKRR